MNSSAQSEFLKRIGKRLHEVRIQGGYSEETVARNLSITVDELKRIENGEVDMDLLLFLDFCGLYGVSVDEVME